MIKTNQKYPFQSLSEKETQAYRDGDDFSDNKAIKSITSYKEPLLIVQHELDEICPKKQTDVFVNSAKLASPKKVVVSKG